MNWLGRLLRRTRMEEQLEKELRFHLEQHTRDPCCAVHETRCSSRRV